MVELCGGQRPRFDRQTVVRHGPSRLVLSAITSVAVEKGGCRQSVDWVFGRQ
jgi:hypothetical protein